MSVCGVCVTEAPTITETSGNQVIRVGDDITLTCNATGVPYPAFTWHKYTATGDVQGKHVLCTTYSHTLLLRAPVIVS